MKITVTPIPPAYVHWTPAQAAPVSLPAIPKLDSKEEEWGGALPLFPAAGGSSVVGVGRGTSSLAGVLSNGLGALLRGGRFVGSGRAFVALAVAGGLAAGMLSPLLFDGEKEAPAYGNVVLPSERPREVAHAEAPAPDPASLIVPEELPDAGAQAAPPAAPAEQPPASPAPAAPAAVEPQGGGRAPELADALKDAPAALKRMEAQRQPLAWTGIAFQSQAGAGGAFQGMRVPRRAALPAAAPPPSAPAHGALSAVRRVSSVLGRGAGVVSGSAQRAMGQLKLARSLSAGGAQQTGYEASRQGVTDAFEQAKTIGGAGLTDGAVPTTGLSGGAPDLTAPTPALPAGTNKTPYQNKVDQAKNDNSMTVMLLIMGALLAAAGLACLVYAHVLKEQGDARMQAGDAPGAGVLWGESAMLRKVGYGLLAAGAAMALMGFLMAQQAKAQANQIGDQYGQKDQQAVIDDCTRQSLGKRDCRPAPLAQPVSGVHQAVTDESGAGYSLGAAGGR